MNVSEMLCEEVRFEDEVKRVIASHSYVEDPSLELYIQRVSTTCG